jgi:hypothetical protein
MCRCSDSEVTSSDLAAVRERHESYEQVFSGITIWTERFDELPNGGMVPSKGWPSRWIKSHILVLRIWRGAPPTIAEVWTPDFTSCDTPPILGFHFVALGKLDNNRLVATSYTCDCAERVFATAGTSVAAPKGIAILAAATSVLAYLLYLPISSIRRRIRASAGGVQPFGTLRTVLAFALFSPLIGGIVNCVWLLGVWLVDVAKSASATERIDSELFLAIFFFSYLFGLIPAALSGLVWGTIARLKSSRTRVGYAFRFTVGGLIGLAAASAFATVVKVAWETPFIGSHPVSAFVAIAVLSLRYPRDKWLAH